MERNATRKENESYTVTHGEGIRNSCAPALNMHILLDRRGASPKIFLGGLAPGPLHVTYPTKKFMSLWTALVVSSQFKVLVGNKKGKTFKILGAQPQTGGLGSPGPSVEPRLLLDTVTMGTRIYKHHKIHQNAPLLEKSKKKHMGGTWEWYYILSHMQNYKKALISAL